jgi:putative flippase GtrA
VTTTVGHRLLTQRITRFFIVSSGSTAVDYLLLFALSRALPSTTSWLAVAIAMGYVVGTVINFFWARRWVFDRSTLHPLVEFGLVAVIAGTGLLLTEVVTLSLNSSLGGRLLVAKTIAVVAVFFWNFLARRAFVYRASTVNQ